MVADIEAERRRIREILAYPGALVKGKLGACR